MHIFIPIVASGITLYLLCRILADDGARYLLVQFGKILLGGAAVLVGLAIAFVLVINRP